MSNIKYDNGPALIGRTYRNEDHYITRTIPTEFARALDIENSKVPMFLLKDSDDNKHLIVSKYHEITI
jgi:hypothetical protein